MFEQVGDDKAQDIAKSQLASVVHESVELHTCEE